MDVWLIWLVSGFALVLAELVIPGLLVVFLGLAAMIVGLGIKFGYLDSLTSIVTTYLVSTLFFLFFIRGFFLKYFEGSSSIQNVDEEKDIQGSIVEVAEDILPHKEGRVFFRGSTWQARSEEEIQKNSKAVIIRTDGNVFIVKSI